MNKRKLNIINSKKHLKTKKNLTKGLKENKNTKNTKKAIKSKKKKTFQISQKKTQIKKSLRISLLSLDKKYLKDPKKVSIYSRQIFNYYKKNEVS